jgi:hypothetical protein
MQELTNSITEINRLHHQAQLSAQNAVEHAKAAGALLLKIKGEMKHGSFSGWVEQNLEVSLRQAQRYMAAAKGKTANVKELFLKSDMVSHLQEGSSTDSSDEYRTGIWEGDLWVPEANYLYMIIDGQDRYWVAPASNGGTHVSRLYSGTRMSTHGFYWRYTIFSENHDPDFLNKYYVGTRFAPIYRKGIHDILKSYGLKDLKGATIYGFHCPEPLFRPFGEPDPEDWYWDDSIPSDDGLHQVHVKLGHANKKGISTFVGS